MRARVRLDTSAGKSNRLVAERLLCEALQTDLASARCVLERVPAVLPIAQTETDAAELAAKLAAVGVLVSVVAVPEGSASACVFHPRYLEANRCLECARSLCIICERQGNGTCTDCNARLARQKRNQRVRVAVLLSILFVVCSVAAREWRRRHLGWEVPHDVAVILVQNPDAPLSEELRVAFANRAHAVERVLTTERQRYAPTAEAPVSLSVFGPVDEGSIPPTLEGSGVWDLLRFNLALDSYADALDDALGIDGSHFDVKIYLRVKDAVDSNEVVEGIGQQRGRLGVVSTQISPDGIDFAWFVVVHEYLHTRGATDKYGPNGRALHPQGYAEPDREPLLPQVSTELMARGRPENATKEHSPEAPETWAIGVWTAQEIGW